jgi:hypothetical protein
MTDHFSSEEFIEQIANADPEELGNALEGAYGDGPLPFTMAQDLDAAGWDVSDFEVEVPDYDLEAAYEPADELADRLGAVEQYLSEVPPEQWGGSAGWEVSPEEYEAELVSHIDGQLEALEAQRGRELSELEIERITVEALQSITDETPFPDVQWAAEIAAENHDERTSTRQGRQAEMTANLQAMNYQEPTQEDVDELAERDDNASRTQLMMHALDGTVSLNGEEDA